MIAINNRFVLTKFVLEDEVRLMEAISDVEIARNTLTIPFPYSEKDARWWLEQCELQNSNDKPQRNWAIRNTEGLVCGSISRHFKYGLNSHKDEIGYWLMRPLWGQGLMTQVIAKFVEHCFQDENLKRLEAPVFEFNKGSARVLEKNGFELEGRMRKAYFKQGAYYDSLLYAKLSA
ncbi:MAG: GNAT family N-acetyltransferase [Flavobacteriales bacterium]|nr:GNAT family N-acetyltransferase [Flavobacteriales bacterium]